MTCDDTEWLTSREPLQVDVLGLTLTTRIPDFDSWSVAAILHPFEDENGQPLEWQEVDKSRGADAIELSAGRDRFSPTTGELDQTQATILLQILCPSRASVHLGFGTDILVTPSSPHTGMQRNTEGQIVASDRQLVVAGGERFLMRQFTGTGLELMESLRTTHGWIEWPNLMWADERSWMLDSHWDVPFTIVAADVKTIDQISSCPGLDSSRVR
ncbi:hypothetical protein [Brevibacterium gallinarum]|uniref:Uncharacterized protein n=1 Tax=Brevibacterium gallinarum TaxID=2762220 RepID=A0ABR8WRH6_9MICO|nr:hypothetical protein [Brevibacterium gallinarum]MBD8019498.1 hypothetical protein [Brevibacterium gallinarum]